MSRSPSLRAWPARHTGDSFTPARMKTSPEMPRETPGAGPASASEAKSALVGALPGCSGGAASFRAVASPSASIARGGADVRPYRVRRTAPRACAGTCAHAGHRGAGEAPARRGDGRLRPLPWYDADEENAARVYRALSRIGAPLDGIEVPDLADVDYEFRHGDGDAEICLFGGLDGVTFADAWVDRLETHWRDVPICVIGRHTLRATELAERVV